MKLPASVGDHRIEFIWVRGPNGQARLVRKGGEDDMVMKHVQRTRKSPISDRIELFLRENPNMEWSLDQIANRTNLTRKQVQNNVSHVRDKGMIVPGSRRGWWKWNTTGIPAPPRAERRYWKKPQNEPTPAVNKAVERKVQASVNPNGSQPFKEGDTIIMDVLRVREDGTVVFVDENRNVLIMRVDTVI